MKKFIKSYVLWVNGYEWGGYRYLNIKYHELVWCIIVTLVGILFSPVVIIIVLFIGIGYIIKYPLVKLLNWLNKIN